MASFTIASLNLQGFNQGEDMARHICDNLLVDVLFIQESWLTPDLLHQLCFISSDYLMYGVSAMTDTVSVGPLYGRPYGGLATLIHTKHKKYIVNHICSERFNIILIGSLALVNVYLPSIINADTCFLFNSLLDDIVTKLDSLQFTNLVFGGDLNCGPVIKFKRAWDILSSKLSRFSLCHVAHAPNAYTFCQDKLGYYSCIDHFFTDFTDSSALKVDHIDVIDDHVNMSDHLGIILFLNGDLSKLFIEPIITPNEAISPPKVVSLNWDLADINKYYDLTRVSLTPILTLLNYCHNYEDLYLNNNCSVVDLINSVYTDITCALVAAGREAVPVHLINPRKFWWDQALSAAKELAQRTHNSWVTAGKPRNGPIFLARNQAKYNYRLQIKNGKNKSKTLVTDRLSSDLCSKNSKRFWKTWKSKFKIKDRSPTINGLSDDDTIANLFAKTIKMTSTPNSPHKNIDFKATFINKISNMHSDNQPIVFDVGIVDKCISSLKKGKAPDFDGLTAEHFQLAHPCLPAIISKLFNLILSSGNVPSAFGHGLSFPIPKGSNRTLSASVDDFRVITICPVLSKIFELCLLPFIESFLKTSPRQFGFKKGTGCNFATHTLKGTVDFFTNKQSNVNVCSLDLAKAFDKLNHFALFSNLLDRGVPKSVISVMSDWFSRTFTCVMWNGVKSLPVPLFSGIRQGGILSPFFFAVYVDKLFVLLENSKLGCFVNGYCVNALMYADDLIVVALTIADLRLLLDICSSFFDEIDMPINFAKSKCIRFGSRFNSDCADIYLNGVILSWVSRLKYLGVTVIAGKHLTCDFAEARHKFFGSFNTIYGRIGSTGSVSLLLFLLASICTPILLFGTEASLGFNKKEFDRICFAYNKAWSKIFHSFDKSVIRSCQFFCGYLPIEYQLDLRSLIFTKSLSWYPDPGLSRLFNYFSFDNRLCEKYDIVDTDSISIIKSKVRQHFELPFENCL